MKMLIHSIKQLGPISIPSFRQSYFFELLPHQILVHNLYSNPSVWQTVWHIKLFLQCTSCWGCRLTSPDTLIKDIWVPMAPVPYTHISARALAIAFSQTDWLPVIPYPSGYYSCMANVCRAIIFCCICPTWLNPCIHQVAITQNRTFSSPLAEIDDWNLTIAICSLTCTDQLRKSTDSMHVGKVIGRLGEVRLYFSDTVVLHRNVFRSWIYKTPWATRGLSQIWGVDYKYFADVAQKVNIGFFSKLRPWTWLGISSLQLFLWFGGDQSPGPLCKIQCDQRQSISKAQIYLRSACCDPSQLDQWRQCKRWKLTYIWVETVKDALWYLT
jgi:hypothetical protein